MYNIIYFQQVTPIPVNSSEYFYRRLCALDDFTTAYEDGYFGPIREYCISNVYN